MRRLLLRLMVPALTGAALIVAAQGVHVTGQSDAARAVAQSGSLTAPYRPSVLIRRLAEEAGVDASHLSLLVSVRRGPISAAIVKGHDRHGKPCRLFTDARGSVASEFLCRRTILPTHDAMVVAFASTGTGDIAQAATVIGLVGHGIRVVTVIDRNGTQHDVRILHSAFAYAGLAGRAPHVVIAYSSPGHIAQIATFSLNR